MKSDELLERKPGRFLWPTLLKIDEAIRNLHRGATGHDFLLNTGAKRREGNDR